MCHSGQWFSYYQTSKRTEAEKSDSVLCFAVILAAHTNFFANCKNIPNFRSSKIIGIFLVIISNPRMEPKEVCRYLLELLNRTNYTPVVNCSNWVSFFTS